jgi:hypothetical protein
MVKFEETTSTLKIIIPVSSMDEVEKYHKGLLGILRKIEVDNCDPTFRENLKSVYELLSHITTDKDRGLGHD